MRDALVPPADSELERDATIERTRLAALYAAVAARVASLRNDGIRPERALLVLKRETNAVIDDLTAAGSAVDGARASEVLRHVVRWSVETYHRAD